MRPERGDYGCLTVNVGDNKNKAKQNRKSGAERHGRLISLISEGNKVCSVKFIAELHAGASRQEFGAVPGLRNAVSIQLTTKP